MTAFRVDTPLATLGVTVERDAVTAIRFHDATDGRPATPFARRVADELVEYLEGHRRTFEFPIAPVGTAFQLRVWEEIRRIPYGEVRS
ncbi:MAG: cysteine methyltransferase, partial [Acidimicrobiia bacterium]|nr:cysteine methyltransferase [Acidimicrobiia bacterium]